MSFYTLIVALKGGLGSGNFGHSGRPGMVGGSAGDVNVGALPKYIFDDMESSFRPNMRPDDLINYHKSLGHSEQDVRTMQNLIQNGLGAGGDAQTLAEREIAYNLIAETPLGKVIKDHINLETWLQNEWLSKADVRVAKNLASVKDDFDWFMKQGDGFNFNGDYYTSKSDWPTIAKEVKDMEMARANVYRKGATGKRTIESWSFNSRGAAMGGRGSNVGWNNRSDLVDMQKKGYKVLAGGAILAGAPGESEITFINMNRI